jgi:hypothetical protein
MAYFLKSIAFVGAVITVVPSQPTLGLRYLKLATSCCVYLRLPKTLLKWIVNKGFYKDNAHILKG